ncbi:carbohydrate kinase family protein [Rubrobacter indicoceani]|uniref:carbohydrate kinase family protein n=1 Tax=Rubrobacter indicoceani TaxID=2051957 RepID=UPI0013C4A3AF|nr:carbohydrate kinase [Rubrobacter indicoceani]
MAERSEAARIVAFGEVVADIYRDPSDSEVELSMTARPGGAPANVAVAAARLGAGAAFIGSVGDDLFGEFVLKALAAEGVEVQSIVRQKAPTRTSLAFVEILPDGDREFTFYRSKPAADELFTPGDVLSDALADASFINFGSIPLLTEPARSAARSLAELAGESGVPFAFDVNYRAHLWSDDATAREAVEPFLDLASVVKLSDDELLPLLRVTDPDEAADVLLERGASLVLVSLGPDGAFYATEGFRGRIPSVEVRVVDATGAGDAFLAATLVKLAGGDLTDETLVREAVRYGTTAGAIACTGLGAMEPLPTGDRLERHIRGEAL